MIPIGLVLQIQNKKDSQLKQVLFILHVSLQVILKKVLILREQCKTHTTKAFNKKINQVFKIFCL